MIRDDRKNDTAVGGATTVVDFNDERRVRGAAAPRLPTRKGGSLADAVAAIESGGTKGEKLLEDMARARAAIQGGNFVREVRKSRGYSQVKLAKRIGVSQARISQWENMQGSGETIDIINLFKIALACDVVLRLDWVEKLTKETGSRRKGHAAHERQERRPRHDQTRHDEERTN